MYTHISLIVMSFYSSFIKCIRLYLLSRGSRYIESIDYVVSSLIRCNWTIPLGGCLTLRNFPKIASQCQRMTRQSNESWDIFKIFCFSYLWFVILFHVDIFSINTRSRIACCISSPPSHSLVANKNINIGWLTSCVRSLNANAWKGLHSAQHSSPPQTMDLRVGWSGGAFVENNTFELWHTRQHHRQSAIKWNL